MRSNQWLACTARWLTLLLAIGVVLLSSRGVVPAGEMSAEELQQRLLDLQRQNEELSARVVHLEQAMIALSTWPYPMVPKLPDRVELCGDEVPLGEQDVRERLEREFYLMLGNPGQLILWIKRAGRYFPHIEAKLKEYGLPDDLKYVSVIESSLSSLAYSSAGAAGYWQFIGSTGRRYQLRLGNHWDDRRDLERSTDAALHYLADLYQRFEDWPLALAAYNSGEERIEREMASQGVDFYYWLKLPLETERYVFRVIAAKIILSDPVRYGFALSAEDLYSPIPSEEVQVRVVGSRLPLREVAEACGTFYRCIRELNPALRVDYLPPGKHTIKVPQGCSDSLLASLEKRDGGRSQTIVHQVRKGETLWDIANRYGVRVASLREWNGLERSSIIRPGDKLYIHK